ncbi:MAG TPA: sigma-70 family RNA polymerase sigma factor [Puia sp.]|jgi:RNA polymerase sigma-70 factor (ECF subfamily)
MSNLFHQFVEGSESAFNNYYKRYNGNVYATLKKLSGDEAVAKDLTQEVFHNLWNRRAHLNNEEHLRNYLFRTARYFFLMYQRGRRKAAAAEDDLRRATAATDDSIELILVRERAFAVVRDTMMKLPPQQKMVMELLMLKGLDVKAVAQRLQLAPQTVRNHKSQALLFLRKELCGRDLSLLLTAEVILSLFPF